jgi:hypothetical protein
MGMQKVRFDGLYRDVWLPDDIEVIIDIVPAWRTNIRSNQVFTAQNKVTWHDTGNPNSNALGERNWLHSGAGGASVGYNFAVDNRRIYQLTPLNEVTWAAGTPDGNKFSWHMEQCLNTNWDGTIYTGAALMGGLIAAMGWDTDKALVQHNYWYGKHCPAQIRNRGLWPSVVQKVKDAAATAKAAAGGVVTPDTGGGYAKGVVPMKDGKPWDGLSDLEVDGNWYIGDPKTVKVAVDQLNRRVGPRSTDALTGPALPLDSTFTVLGWVAGVEVDGENRWWITPWGSHMWVGGTAEKPTEKPTFDPDTVRTIIADRVYYPAGVDQQGREVVLVEDANLYRWADFDSPTVGSKSANEKVVAKYWCRGDADDLEDIWWVLDAEGENDIDLGARLHVTSTFQRPF